MGATADLQVVSLASQTSAPTSLATNPPDGITGALKLATLDTNWGDQAFAGVFYPPPAESSTTGSPAQAGLFNGVSLGRRALPQRSMQAACLTPPWCMRSTHSAACWHVRAHRPQVLFKDFAADPSTRLAYDWYRTARAGDYGAPTLRLLLRSPAWDTANQNTAPNFVQMVYVRAGPGVELLAC